MVANLTRNGASVAKLKTNNDNGRLVYGNIYLSLYYVTQAIKNDMY